MRVVPDCPRALNLKHGFPSLFDCKDEMTRLGPWRRTLCLGSFGKALMESNDDFLPIACKGGVALLIKRGRLDFDIASLE